MKQITKRRIKPRKTKTFTRAKENNERKVKKENYKVHGENCQDYTN